MRVPEIGPPRSPVSVIVVGCTMIVRTPRYASYPRPSTSNAACRGDRHLDLVTEAEAVRRFPPLVGHQQHDQVLELGAGVVVEHAPMHDVRVEDPAPPLGKRSPAERAAASPVGEKLGRHLRIVPGAAVAARLEGT